MEGYEIHGSISDETETPATIVPAMIEAPAPPSCVIPSRRGAFWDGVDWETVAELYRKGETFPTLANAFQIPATTIHGRLKKMGVEFNRKRKAMSSCVA